MVTSYRNYEIEIEPSLEKTADGFKPCWKFCWRREKVAGKKRRRRTSYIGSQHKYIFEALAIAKKVIDRRLEVLARQQAA